MRKARVLIVEDEEVIALDIKLSLEEIGHSVVGVASSGEEAVALARAADPDVVLVDYQLSGGMNGIEASRKLYESGSRAHFVFVTAYAREKTDGSGIPPEKTSYVPKPFDIRSIDAEIRKALER